MSASDAVDGSHPTASQCRLLATQRLSEWSAGRSAYPPTPDIEMGIRLFRGLGLLYRRLETFGGDPGMVRL
jgi:hypothetical protein